MQRILFVDDEVAILDGLRNVLRGERRRWTMRFVDCAKAALDALASEPFDVIVSDIMRGGPLCAVVNARRWAFGETLLRRSA